VWSGCIALAKALKIKPETLGEVDFGIIAKHMSFIAAALKAETTDDDTQERIARAVALLAKKEEARSSDAEAASHSPSTIGGRRRRGVAKHHLKPLFKLLADAAFLEDERMLREMIEGTHGQGGVRKHAHKCIAFIFQKGWPLFILALLGYKDEIENVPIVKIIADKL
jgi:hypothetical protein